jgi:hypothetical protein
VASGTARTETGAGSVQAGLAEDAAITAAKSRCAMNDETIEIQKRHTLNWLIQGAAQHAGMTFHHLIRDELNALDPGLVPLYDLYALINLLQYWQPTASRFYGSPPQFWKGAETKLSHPFFGHPLLGRYGGKLAEAGRQRGVERSKEKGLTTVRGAFTIQTLSVVKELRRLEAPHRLRLVELAKQAAATVWGIPQARLEGEMVEKIVLEPGMLPGRSFAGLLFRACITGYGCVVRRGEELVVVGKGTNWQLVTKELVKGTAELICLHGLNQFSDDTYARVTNVTDRLDLEPWMLQSGGELWRRLLAVMPADVPLAQMLMRLARLPAESLHSMVAAAIEERGSAQRRWAELLEEKRS